MTASLHFLAEPHPSRGLSQLAAGAILTRARRLLFVSGRVFQPFPGATALAGACGEKAAGSILIAKVGFGLSDHLGSGASDPLPPRIGRNLSCSFERSPTHNQCGYGSERNEIGVGFDADVVGRGPVGRHPSFLSPGLPVVVTFGARNSEHESKEFPDDGNLTAQRIKLTARGGNAKG